MNNTNQLKTINLTKAYKKKTILNGINLSIDQQQIVGLLGPNGAGKTTCFYSILGLIKASSGSIELNSQNIIDLPIHKRAQLGLGYLPQEPSIFRKLSAEDNILSILEHRPNLANKSQQLSQLEKLLAEFNIQHIRHTKGVLLSGGERRRVEIARAIASQPKFLLLDEPFAGIDPKSILDIKNILLQLKAKQLGILLTDHNVRETLDICDKVYILYDGKIMAEGDSQTILHNPQVRRLYLGDYML